MFLRKLIYKQSKNIVQRMGDFLKEYQLYNDLSRLNNEFYFSESFDVHEINDFLASLKEKSDLQLNEKTLRIFLINLRKAKDKSVYVALKWLFCLHRLLPNVSNGHLLEKIYDSLSKIEIPAAPDRIDQFINEGIIKPYIHFLAKMCLINMQELDQTMTNAEQQDKENCLQSPAHKDNLAYFKYNLIRHSAGDLLCTVIELQNYFRSYYPILSKIPLLLHRDLTNLLRSIRGEVKTGQLQAISQEQMQSLESQIDKLDKRREGNEQYFEIQCTQISQKLSFFMESGHKQERKQIKQSKQQRTLQF